MIPNVRIDDRLVTILRHAASSTHLSEHNWRQLIDIIAQNPKNFPSDQVAAGLLQIRKLLPYVEDAERLSSVLSLTGRIRFAPLVQLLAADKPAIASAVIMGAKLYDREWAELIPNLSTLARGFLRNRNDIGPQTRKALMIWSGADFILSGPEQEIQVISVPDALISNTLHHPDNTKIADIVARIERLRRERENTEAPQLPLEGGELADNHHPITEIRFETDDNGILCWVEGAPRGALIGVGISQPALENGPGPDAFGASAFRQRIPLENIRMRLCGALIVGGDWRINAAPFFDGFTGRFRGYRGIFRRPNLSEFAHIEKANDRDSDQIQQLIHELRTPLGAIIGFSEIIEQQLFGPVSSDYRRLATQILGDGRRLLAGFDDIAMAAKIDAGQFLSAKGSTDCHWLANRLVERLQTLSKTLQATLNFSKAEPIRRFAIDSELAERLFSRLISAVIIGCKTGEELKGRFSTEPGASPVNLFILTLPKKLKPLNETELFGSGMGSQDDGDQSPLLGLGFSLRLVRSLAHNVGGDLRFDKETLILSIPAVIESDLQSRA